MEKKYSMAKLTVKDKVLMHLSENIDKNVSGEELAKILGVSRAAIWKSVNALKTEGYNILAVTNKGYRLLGSSDVLSDPGILNAIKSDVKPKNYCYKTIDSTNTEAKKLCNDNTENMLIVSEEQTAGRGRMGREFFSPKKTGIYMSIVLKSDLKLENAVLVTTAVSVAVCKAIEKISTQKPQIKWVNDIYLNSKKICGILTEATTNFELGTVENLIIGIGMNLRLSEDLPQELKEIATSLFDTDYHGVKRNDVIACIYDEVCKIIDNELDKAEFIKEYREYSMILGKEIIFLKEGVWRNAKAMDIDKMGALVVQTENGETEVLNSGEVSVRKIK